MAHEKEENLTAAEMLRENLRDSNCDPSPFEEMSFEVGEDAIDRAMMISELPHPSNITITSTPNGDQNIFGRLAGLNAEDRECAINATFTEDPNAGSINRFMEQWQQEVQRPLVNNPGPNAVDEITEHLNQEVLDSVRRGIFTEHEFDIADYKVVEILSHEDALQKTKHCGWCTGKTDNNHYINTYQHGKIWIFYKPKSRRPSYQLYIGPTGGIEFRKKGNKTINPWDFAEANESVKEFMLDLLGDKPKSNGRFRGLGMRQGTELPYDAVNFYAPYIPLTYYSRDDDGIQWHRPRYDVEEDTSYKAKPLQRMLDQRVKTKQAKDKIVNKSLGWLQAYIGQDG